MRKEPYLPSSDKERVIWLNNFANKFAQVGASMGFTAADINSVLNDAAMFTYLINLIEMYTTAKEQRVAYKNLIKDGPIGTPGGSLPIAPAPPVPPVTVAPGIFQRVAQWVQRIKNASIYTEDIGKSMGIIGAEDVKDLSAIQPTLKLAIKGSTNVEVKWNKGDADGIYIETDKGNGWQFLATYTKTRYRDETPITTPAIWKYKAIYIVDNEHMGNWSAVVSIVVGNG